MGYLSWGCHGSTGLFFGAVTEEHTGSWEGTLVGKTLFDEHAGSPPLFLIGQEQGWMTGEVFLQSRMEHYRGRDVWTEHLLCCSWYWGET